jgi:hypothetical protein
MKDAIQFLRKEQQILCVFQLLLRSGTSNIMRLAHIYLAVPRAYI